MVILLFQLNNTAVVALFTCFVFILQMIQNDQRVTFPEFNGDCNVSSVEFIDFAKQMTAQLALIVMRPRVLEPIVPFSMRHKDVRDITNIDNDRPRYCLSPPVSCLHISQYENLHAQLRESRLLRQSEQQTKYSEFLNL